MPRIIGIGQSHLISVNHAADDWLEREPDRFEYVPICFVWPQFHPPFTNQNGTSIPNPAWVDVLRRHAGESGTQVLLTVPGAEWWHWSLTPGPTPFDFIDRLVDDDAPLQGSLVPYDLFMRRARDAFRYIPRIIDVVREVSDFPVSLSPPPPPMRRIDIMFAEYAAGKAEPGQPPKRLPPMLRELIPTFDQYGFRPDAFRMKVWRVCMRAVQDICAEHDVTYLPPPPQAVDADGFLLPSMVSDFVHANRAWAKLQLERLLAVSRQPHEVLS